MNSKEASKAFREANPDYHRKWYATNADRLNAATKRHQAKRRAMLDALKDKPCMDCGGSFPPECMDFDHREGEVKEIMIASALRRAWLDILAEIEKCDLVCANCHRIRTKKRGYTNKYVHHNVQLPL